ncbi:MAG: AraC family ligand binding domain-containing protein [Elainellaceae cyanobacterium]
MKCISPDEQAKLWRDPIIQNLELLRATYVTHSFSRHVHEGFGIAILEEGAMEFTCRGATHVAPAGSVVIVHPDEVHTGHAAFETGWTYRTLLPGAELLQQAASELSDRPISVPYFPDPVIQDPKLNDCLLRLHIALETSDSPLERESRLLWNLARLIIAHASDRPLVSAVSQETRAVERVRDYLLEHFDQNISLHDLATMVNLSSLRLLRVFRRHIGLPPHAFLTQVRIHHAKKLLSMGWTVAQVALETGFTDQSHLSRHFKRMVGVPPGRYAHGCKNVQDFRS